MYNINSEVLEYRPKVYGFVEFLVLAELWLSKQEGMQVQLRLKGPYGVSPEELTGSSPLRTCATKNLGS